MRSITVEFFRPDGQLAGRVLSSGGWLDRRVRGLVVPPRSLGEVLRNAPRTAAFMELASLAAA